MSIEVWLCNLCSVKRSPVRLAICICLFQVIILVLGRNISPFIVFLGESRTGRAVERARFFLLVEFDVISAV